MSLCGCHSVDVTLLMSLCLCHSVDSTSKGEASKNPNHLITRLESLALSKKGF